MLHKTWVFKRYCDRLFRAPFKECLSLCMSNSTVHCFLCYSTFDTKTAEKSFWLKKKEQVQPHEVSKERNRTLAFKSHFPAPRTSALTPFLLFHRAIQKQCFSLTYCPNETWSMLFTSQLKDRAKCWSKKGLKLEKLMEARPLVANQTP